MRYIIIIFLLLITNIGFSQYNKNNYSTKSKKAIKLFESAYRSYNSMKYEDALKYLAMAKKADKKFIEPYLLEANIFEETAYYQKEIDAYKAALAIDSNFSANIYYFLGETEYRMAFYDASVKHLMRVAEFKDAKPRIKKMAQIILERAIFAAQAVKHPVPFKPVNLGDKVNSKYDEYWPSLTADEQTLFITRLVPIDKHYPVSEINGQEDFYYSIKQEDGSWGIANSLGYPINTPNNEGAPTVSADGQSYYFTACNRKDGLGKYDIYFSKRIGDKWTKPVNIGAPVNTKYWESQPSISADGQRLFFVSSRPGGKGELDIWVSHLQANGKWGVPVNLGDSINTPLKEMSPFIHPDGKTLYFSSDGWVGMGGDDLFIARQKDSDTSWFTPKNLGYPINTNGDEIGLIVNTRGNLAMFSSRRDAKKGRDIFEFNLPEKFRPDTVIYVTGKVYDNKTKTPLGTKIELFDLKTSERVALLSSNDGDGTFLVCLPTGKDYALSIRKTGYLFYSENFSLKQAKNDLKNFKLDVPLEPIDIGNKVVLKNIFFETDKYNLKPESKIELQNLI
ncbi:MAG TPA: hypothetical protein EYP69_06135, partial [Bacteroidales bacterium]|nr:hypothetical protein [Bacteroidales bacterium]